MREFETKDGKINFADKNDVLIGFDNTGSCCENFGWFYSDKVPTEIQDRNTPKDLENFFFDKNFYQKIEMPAHLDAGGFAVFKLLEKLNWPVAALINPEIAEKAANAKEVYLCLYNAHNGYYSHGFNMDVGGETLHSGAI